VTSDWRSEAIYLPKVSIARILPGISQQELFSRKKCYLGISIENPLFEGDSLRAMLVWAADKFEHCLVIVGDYLCRFNEQILHACDENRAGELAVGLGDSFLRGTKELFEELPAERVRLTRWKEHLQTEQFSRSKAVLDELFESDDDFRASIEYDASSFVKRLRRRNTNPAVDVDHAVRLSCEYILEEVAVFASLSESGWSVELYPGSELRVLAQVAKGRYPRVP
jgi:tRNA-dependent cyclodipeptide synthase